jgi:hypothetical protein
VSVTGRALALVVVAALAGLASCGPDKREREHQARLFVYQKLSQPGRPVVVGPAVVASDFAVVDFTRGAFTGGRVLLRREDGAWKLALCGGAPVRRRPIVEREGRVPDIAAGLLMTKLWAEESRIDQGRREQLDRWESLPPALGCPEARG